MTKYYIKGAHPENEGIDLPLASSQLRELKPSYALNVYVVLLLSVDSEGLCELSMREIAKLTSLSLGTVRDALALLSDLGHVTTTEKQFYTRRKIPVELRWQVYKRDRYRCVYCGTDDGPFEVDHVLPVDRGGANDIANLVTCCPQCNREKSNKLAGQL